MNSFPTNVSIASFLKIVTLSGWNKPTVKYLSLLINLRVWPLSSRIYKEWSELHCLPVLLTEKMTYNKKRSTSGHLEESESDYGCVYLRRGGGNCEGGIHPWRKQPEDPTLKNMLGYLPFRDIFLRKRHWQVWECVVTNRNSSWIANEVMFEATCGKQRSIPSADVWEEHHLTLTCQRNNRWEKNRKNSWYLSIINEKMASVSQAKDGFLTKRGQNRVRNEANHVLGIQNVLC